MSSAGSRPGVAASCTLAFFAALFLFHTSQVRLGDVWWHLNQGRWIVDHRELPVRDHFTYSIPPQEELRKQLILRGYWLAQIAFYLVHSAGGAVGLVLVGLLPWFLHRFEEIRPQVFSFLGTVLVFYLLERSLLRLRRGAAAAAGLWAIPAVMLLWANVHRGYIIGWGMIGIYLAAEAVRRIRGPSGLDRERFRSFAIWCALGLAVPLANPNLGAAFAGNLIELRSSFVKQIDEFLPLWTYANLVNNSWLLYGVLATGCFALLILLLAWRRVDAVHAVLFVVFAVAGLRTFRFSIFFTLLAVAIAGQYLSGAGLRRWRALRVGVPVTAALLGIALVAIVPARSAFFHGPVDRTFLPEKAVQFVQAHEPPRPLFNAFEHGGYLGWKLYPDYRVFVDPRNLDQQVYREYVQARDGDYAPVFREYGVNTVVFYLVTPVIRGIPELVLRLLKDPAWRPTFLGDLCAVFVRDGEAPELPGVDREAVWSRLIDRAVRWGSHEGGNPAPYVMLGRIYRAREDLVRARACFVEALKVRPGYPEAISYLRAVQAEDTESAATPR